TFSTTGAIKGTPSAAGSYSVSVQVVDATGTVDSKRVSLQVSAGAPASVPVITEVKAKKGKKLTIIGVNFRPDSMIILNGLALAPLWFEQDGTTTILFVKQPFGAAGTNMLFVQNPDNRSAGFIF